MPIENGVLIASIKLRGDTLAELNALDPVLLDREVAVETDTYTVVAGKRVYKCKIGPGQWSALPYAALGDAGMTEADVTALISNHVAATDPHGDRAYTDAQVSALGTAAQADTGTAAGNVPVLGAEGTLPISTLPALAITDTFEVGSQSAMLALTAERGDVAIRSDLNKCFVLAAEPASTLANWKELKTPTDAVLSVAGLAGAITTSDLLAALALGNVDNTADADKPLSTPQAAALADKANKLITINAQTGTSYVTVLGDAGVDKILTQDNASAITCTIPPNSSVAYPVGTVINGIQAGNGVVTITPGGGVTLFSRGSALKTAGKGAYWTALKVATDTWFVTGDLIV